MIGHTLRGCVDWNTHFYIVLNHFPESHPTWVCGLKLNIHFRKILIISHTLRGCVDWNMLIIMAVYRAKVTPYVGVWIETWIWETCLCSGLSHPTWVCGLKQCDMTQILLNQGHTLRGCVDWNVIGNGSLISILCHTLRGCVDWNSQAKVCSFLSLGHTLRGCVDWNNDEVNTCIDNQSHPTWVCGLKHPHVIVFKTIVKSHPTWVCGLKPPVPCYVPKV